MIDYGTLLVHSRKHFGISLRVEHFQKYNEKRDVISQDWMIFLKNANVFPILIPNTLSDIKSFLQEMDIDAFILSGGDNIGDDPERDKTENEIIRFAIDNKISILGVCRGMQVINKFFGGTMNTINDMSHVKKNHKLELINQKMSELISHPLTVNSFHNNIISKQNLGKDLEAFAITKNDNTVEGYFHKEFPIIGVMWHPERENSSQTALELIRILEKREMWENI